jgi:hypothetical protein
MCSAESIRPTPDEREHSDLKKRPRGTQIKEQCKKMQGKSASSDEFLTAGSSFHHIHLSIFTHNESTV